MVCAFEIVMRYVEEHPEMHFIGIPRPTRSTNAYGDKYRNKYDNGILVDETTFIKTNDCPRF